MTAALPSLPQQLLCCLEEPNPRGLIACSRRSVRVTQRDSCAKLHIFPPGLSAEFIEMKALKDRKGIAAISSSQLTVTSSYAHFLSFICNSFRPVALIYTEETEDRRNERKED
jgi:hypothetical protein